MKARVEVLVLVDAGTGSAERFEIVATRAGRRLEVTTGRGVVEVAEVTRTGRPVRSGRFMARRVVAPSSMTPSRAAWTRRQRQRLGSQGPPAPRGGS